MRPSKAVQGQVAGPPAVTTVGTAVRKPTETGRCDQRRVVFPVDAAPTVSARDVHDGKPPTPRNDL